MMERTAAMLVYPLLDDGQATVGFEVCVKHVGGGAEGSRCTARARLDEISTAASCASRRGRRRRRAHDRRRHARAADRRAPEACAVTSQAAPWTRRRSSLRRAGRRRGARPPCRAPLGVRSASLTQDGQRARLAASTRAPVLARRAEPRPPVAVPADRAAATASVAALCVVPQAASTIGSLPARSRRSGVGPAQRDHRDARARHARADRALPARRASALPTGRCAGRC